MTWFSLNPQALEFALVIFLVGYFSYWLGRFDGFHDGKWKLLNLDDLKRGEVFRTAKVTPEGKCAVIAVSKDGKKVIALESQYAFPPVFTKGGPWSKPYPEPVAD